MVHKHEELFKQFVEVNKDVKVVNTTELFEKVYAKYNSHAIKVTLLDDSVYRAESGELN